MVKDAEMNADEDKARRELAEARNKAEAAIHQAETSLKDHGDQAEEDLKADIEAAVKELQELKDSDDTADITDKTEILSAALMKMGAAMYENAAAEEDAGPAKQADDAEDEDIVDAEFEDVDEDDKA